MRRKIEIRFDRRDRESRSRSYFFQTIEQTWGIFSIWILSSRINARGSFFRLGKFAAPRRESPLSRQTHSSPLCSRNTCLSNYNYLFAIFFLFFFFFYAKFESIANRKLGKKSNPNISSIHDGCIKICSCTIKKISISWKKKEAKGKTG